MIRLANGMSSKALSSADGPLVWIGASGFEQRCGGSLDDLSKTGLPLRQAYILDYRLPVEVRSGEEAARTRNRDFMKLSARAVDNVGKTPIIRDIEPYGLGTIRRILTEVAQEVRDSHLILDITSLTRAHVIGAANWFAETRESLGAVTIAYTSPKTYGAPARHHTDPGRWRDVILSPVQFDPGRSFGPSLGLVLLSHDGSRLSVALDQLAPDRALLILAKSSAWDPLELVARTANASLLRRVEANLRPGWSLETVGARDVVELTELVDRMFTDGADEATRVVVYPFGPKALVFASTLIASQRLPSGLLWYCYPIPMPSNLEYAKGIGETTYFRAHW